MKEPLDHPEIYSREYYQLIFDLEGRHWWHIGMRAIAAALLHSLDQPGLHAQVLDAGCGTGGAMLWAKDAVGASSVAGADISLEALQFCSLHPGFLLSQGSVLQLPFKSGSFDLIICQDVLQHLPTDEGDSHALVEMHRVLRPGGLLLVRANSRLGMWQEDGAQDADYQRYTLPEIVSRMKAAGFVVKRSTYANVLPALYASLKRRIQLRFSPRRNRLYEGLGVRDSVCAVSWLNRLLIRILAMEAHFLSAPERSFAFGHTTFCLAMKPHNEVAEPFG